MYANSIRRNAWTCARCLNLGTSLTVITPRLSSYRCPGVASAWSKSSRLMCRPWSCGPTTTYVFPMADSISAAAPEGGRNFLPPPCYHPAGPPLMNWLCATYLACAPLAAFAGDAAAAPKPAATRPAALQAAATQPALVTLHLKDAP